MFTDAVKTIEDQFAKNISLNLHHSGDGILNELTINTNFNNLVVFLDINMPKKNGLEVLEVLRKDEKFKKVPVIMLSTSSDARVIDKALELGANLYAIKPTSYDILKNIIVKIIHINWSEFNSSANNFVIRA